MGQRRELIQTLQVSQQQVADLCKINRDWRRYGIETPNGTKLIAGLGLATTALGFIKLGPLAATAVAISGAILDAMEGVFGNEIDGIKYIINEAEDWLNEISCHGNWPSGATLVEIEVSFLEFLDSNVRVITGRVWDKRYYINGSWVS